MSSAKRFLFALILILMTEICGAADEPRVQEIPLPKDATDVSYMRKCGDIRLKVTSDMKTAGNFYSAILKEQQWTKSGKDNLQKNFWVQSFAKNNCKLEVRVDQRDGSCEIRLTPTGFAWDEDLAPRPKDLPIPEDAKEIVYEDFFERIEFQSATPLEKLADFYVNKLDSKMWSKSGEDLMTKSTVQLKRTSGKATVTVSIRHQDAGNHVTIATKGMVWDDIKTANDLAKKEKDKTADRTVASTTNRSKSVVMPARVDKPMKGIAKLDRLPSHCTITVEGKRVELSQIIAYECISQGRWRTKIVATDAALNQQALVETLKATGTDDGWDLSAPFLKLELDDRDRPVSVSLSAEKVPGGATGDDIEGEALVEEGRARGSVKTKPRKFFEKEYVAEITFDVPLLTRESTPPKRLLNAAKLPNSAKLTIGGKTYSLTQVTVYETQQFDNVMTAVLLTERPINLAKLKASLAKPGRNDDDFVEFQPQIKLLLNSREQLRSVSIWCDGLSISSTGADNMKAAVVIEDGRARGTAKTTESGETFGKKYDFDVSFDATVLPLPVTAK